MTITRSEYLVSEDPTMLVIVKIFTFLLSFAHLTASIVSIVSTYCERAITTELSCSEFDS